MKKYYKNIKVGLRSNVYQQNFYIETKKVGKKAFPRIKDLLVFTI